MLLDLYQNETAHIAREQGALLDEAREKMDSATELSRLEQNGVLHALQVLVENAIGKSKHLLKAKDDTVPISAYDCFLALARQGVIPEADLPLWNAAIGLRNRIVHDYMNIDMRVVLDLVRRQQYRFVIDFLLKPF